MTQDIENACGFILINNYMHLKYFIHSDLVLNFILFIFHNIASYLFL